MESTMSGEPQQPQPKPEAKRATAFDEIRKSTLRYLEDSADVKINAHALQKFAATLRDEDLRKAERTPFPLKFQDLKSELNFLCLVNILNFGSGYRDLLHEHISRGAYDTMAYGCIAAHISQTIDADFLLNLKLIDIPQLFGIPIDVDVEFKKAMYTTEPSPLRPLASKIVAVCNETGRIMRARQWEGFADFVLESLNDIRERNSPSPASDFIEELAKTFPAFNDRYEITSTCSDASDSQTNSKTWHVAFYKKAQLLTFDLHRTFSTDRPLFFFEDIQEMTVCADNVIPAVLRHFGILEYSQELERTIDFGKPLKAKATKDKGNECAIRAAAIVACDEIMKTYQQCMADEREHDEKNNTTTKYIGSGPCDDVAGNVAGNVAGDVAGDVENKEVMVFEIGDKVVVDGLKNKPELNGIKGVIVGNSKDGRHAVELVGSSRKGKRINIRVENLQKQEHDESRPITNADLDYYLWRVLGKQEQIRKKPRHLMQDTVFY